MKRNELKAIVKECLLEILMEGVASGQPQAKKEINNQVMQSPVRRSPLDKIIPSSTVSEQKNQRQRREQSYQSQTLEMAKKIVPNDAVMASIFADTASTTLREQVAADSGRPVIHNDTGVDPMSLFENADNWASLAFSEHSKNRNRAE